MKQNRIAETTRHFGSELILAACLLGTTTTALSQDLSVAGGKVAVCLTCHGVAGKSNNPIYPHLAGQHMEYLVSSLKAYRDGARTDPLMAPMAQNLTDPEIQELADFYSQQKP